MLFEGRLRQPAGVSRSSAGCPGIKSAGIAGVYRCDLFLCRGRCTGHLLFSYPTKNYAEALALHRKELAQAAKLAAAEPLNTQMQRIAAYARVDVGTDLGLSGDSAGERAYLAGAQAEFERLFSADPKNAQLGRDIEHVKKPAGQGLEAAGNALGK